MAEIIGSGVTHEEGASAVEYGLLVSAIAAVIAIVVFTLGGFVGGWFSTTCNRANDANVGQGGTAFTCS